MVPYETVVQRRLRVFHAFLHARYAARVQQLTFTDVDPLCRCHGSNAGTPMVSSFARLRFESLIALLPRAKNIRLLRSALPTPQSSIADGC